jgi:hypothetical protein
MVGESTVTEASDAEGVNFNDPTNLQGSVSRDVLCPV